MADFIESECIIQLKCNHIYHLDCFNYHIQHLYINNIIINKKCCITNIKCPICNDKNTNILYFFTRYQQFLEKCKIIKKWKMLCNRLIFSKMKFETMIDFTKNNDRFTKNNDRFTKNNDRFTKNNDRFTKNNDKFTKNNDRFTKNNDRFTKNNDVSFYQK